MILRIINRRAAFTLVEVLVASSLFSIFAAGIFTIWMSVQSSALNVTAYARRQGDQLRVADYLKRDIRRATSIQVYNNNVLLAGVTPGNELRIVVPDFYSDAQAEDHTTGSVATHAPTMTGGEPTYGSAISVRYYVSNGVCMRSEGGVARPLVDAAGTFTVTYTKEADSRIRCRIIYALPQRGGQKDGVTRTLNRQVDLICGQRAQLEL